MWAVQEGYFGIVELLLQRGSNVNTQKNDGATPLFLGTAPVPVLSRLRADRPNFAVVVVADGWLLVSFFFVVAAVLSGDTRMVSLLLAYGARNEIPNDQGETPHMVARRTGLHDIAHLLLVPPPFSLVDQL
jgi:ankyrin repeat protein